MFWKRSEHAYGRTETATTPYQRAAQVWDERIGSARVQARNWRLVAIGSLALTAVMCFAYVQQSGTSLITPYVVEMEPSGAVRTISPTIAEYEPTDAQIAYHLAEFINRIRSVSLDDIVLRQNWLDAYNYTTDQGAQMLTEYAREYDPFVDVGHRSVTVEIASIVRSSNDSFDVRWRETHYRDNVHQSTGTHTAVLTITINPPRDEATLHKNPLGVYVHGINWSKDLIQGE